jgi:hypothetical protein
MSQSSAWRSRSIVGSSNRFGIGRSEYLIDRIRVLIERHRVAEFTAASAHPFHCQAEKLSDHSGHVAQEIVARLGLRAEVPVNAEGEIRYVSAWFDDELTKLQGAE